MIYINTEIALGPLVEIWTRNRDDIKIGHDIRMVEEMVRNRVPIFLIHPWCHIQKDTHAKPTSESQQMINVVQKAINDNICIIFGGLGEVEYFGSTVITDLLTKRMFDNYLALLTMKQKN